jgi:predicted acyltransferase
MTIAPVLQPSPDVEAVRTGPKRLLSVDVFRGLLVAGMVLVTNPGTYDFIYWPLKHSDWNGSTPTDMIFPSFLFLAGVSMTFSFASRRERGETKKGTAAHVVWRSLLLMAVGVLLNCFDLLHLPNLRLPGVLQRIGLCYLCAGLLYLSVQEKKPRVRFAVIGGVMIALPATYWVLQTLVPVPGYGVGRLDAAGTLSAYIDRAVFTTTHLWHWGGPGQMWDPEGLLTTLPAIDNLLLGVLTGEWLRRRGGVAIGRRVLGMAVAGAGLMLAAMVLDPMIPINKKIWTPSFILLSGGFRLLAMALLYWVIDARGWRRGLTPALVYGSNAILGFALANMISPIFGLIGRRGGNGKLVMIPGIGFEFFVRFLNPWNASLAYAVLFVLFIMAILWPLYRRRIFIRL